MANVVFSFSALVDRRGERDFCREIGTGFSIVLSGFKCDCAIWVLVVWVDGNKVGSVGCVSLGFEQVLCDKSWPLCRGVARAPCGSALVEIISDY